MKGLIFSIPLIFICGTAQSDASIDQTKVVLGQLLIKETFSRVFDGKGVINPPVTNLENTITPSFITNPRKTCWVSPQYHSDATVTPRLVCH